MKNKRSRTHIWEDIRIIGGAVKIMNGMDPLQAPELST